MKTVKEIRCVTDSLQIYACVRFIDLIKVVIGLLMLRSDFWACKVVND